MHWEGEEMVSCQLLISLQTTCGFVWLCKIELRPVTSDYLFLELNLGQLQNWDLKRVFVKGYMLFNMLSRFVIAFLLIS